MPERSLDEAAGAGLPEAVAFELRTKPGGTNYGDCAGVYSLSEQERLLNGKPVYINDEAENFLGFNGSHWVISSLAQKDRIIRDQKKGFKGFHAGGSGEPDDHDWGQYVVLRRSIVEVAPQPEAIVRIQGLLSAQELNGARGTCQNLDAGSGRWAVLLEGGELKLLRPENLLVCRAPPEPQGLAEGSGAEGSGAKGPEVAAERPPPAAPPLAVPPPPAAAAAPPAAEAPAAGAVAQLGEAPPPPQPRLPAPPKPSPAPAARPPSSAPSLAARLGGARRPEAAAAAGVEELRAELDQVRADKRLAALEEDFARAKELRARELELDARLQDAEATAAGAPAAEPEQPAESGGAGTLRALDNGPEARSAAHAGLAGEVARLYEERAELGAAERRAAEGGQDGSQAEELRQQSDALEGKIAEAEAAALAGLLAEIGALRGQLEAVAAERRRAWRAEEEERTAELEQQRSKLEAKLLRLQAAAARAAAAAEAAPPARPAPSRQPGGGGGASLMRKLQQHRTVAPATCASCGAAAEPRASPDGLGYCSWCWGWWDSQQPSAEASAPSSGPAARAREPGQAARPKVGAQCFWDQRGAASEAEAQGLQRPGAVSFARGASASGGGMRLLAAAPTLDGSAITEEEAAAIGWGREGSESEEPGEEGTA